MAHANLAQSLHMALLLPCNTTTLLCTVSRLEGCALIATSAAVGRCRRRANICWHVCSGRLRFMRAPSRWPHPSCLNNNGAATRTVDACKQKPHADARGMQNIASENGVRVESVGRSEHNELLYV